MISQYFGFISCENSLKSDLQYTMLSAELLLQNHDVLARIPGMNFQGSIPFMPIFAAVAQLESSKLEPVQEALYTVEHFHHE